jgi:hypothetical protein
VYFSCENEANVRKMEKIGIVNKAFIIYYFDTFYRQNLNNFPYKNTQ